MADSGLGRIQVRFSAAVWNATHMVVSNLAVSAAEEGEEDPAFDATVLLDAAVMSIRRLPQDADSVLVSLSGEQWVVLLDAVQRSRALFERLGDRESMAVEDEAAAAIRDAMQRS